MAQTVKVAVTGAAGQIGYSILPRLLNGEVFGPQTRIALSLLEVTPALKALSGVVMELDDCAFPLCESIEITDDARKAFTGANWALLIGARPRSKGMERGDLIKVNGPIFTGQGEALNHASDDVRVVVVGNPANTNALIAMHNSDVPNDRFSALTFLDHNRALAQIAQKARVRVTEITNLTIWGNHSATQFPDVAHARISARPVTEVITDSAWLRGPFIETVQKRGAAIIDARGQSSAMSAANAVLDHVRAFTRPTKSGDWFSAAVPSDGSYGIDEKLIFSFPLQSDGRTYKIVQGLAWDEFAKEQISRTLAELREEKDVVKDLLR